MLLGQSGHGVSFSVSAESSRVLASSIIGGQEWGLRDSRG